MNDCLNFNLAIDSLWLLSIGEASRPVAVELPGHNVWQEVDVGSGVWQAIHSNGTAITIAQANVESLQRFKVVIEVDGLNVQNVQLNGIVLQDAKDLHGIKSRGRGLKT